jgi:hypothetical protein
MVTAMSTDSSSSPPTTLHSGDTGGDGAPAAAVSTTSGNSNSSSSKGTFKRDALRQNERDVQQKWDDAKVYEVNPPSVVVSNDDNTTKESFMVTFPYPYANGHLHIGHAFSLTKAIFRAQYERHLQKNVLFPFAFHCTGMPIQAVRLWVAIMVLSHYPCLVHVPLGCTKSPKHLNHVRFQRFFLFHALLNAGGEQIEK